MKEINAELLEALKSIMFVCDEIAHGKGELNMAVVRGFSAVAAGPVARAVGIPVGTVHELPKSI